MRKSTIAVALLLAGCSTTRVLEIEPSFVITSTKSTDALTECISLAIAPLGQPSVIPGESRTIVAVGGESLTSTVVTIGHDSPHTIIFRSQMMAQKHWIEKVRGCA
ncbi:MAG: hypothetical protein CMN63_06825 [Sphingobium sp.]|nr:hypothetical protein [Sphingobium sp.]